jgi:hypothetical protein
MPRARPGKEHAIEEFLSSAQSLVRQPIGTTSWYAVRHDSSQYGIFDTFRDEAGRGAHINGQISRLLFTNLQAAR